MLIYSCRLVEQGRDLTRRPENATPPPLKRLKRIFLKPDGRVTAAASNPFEKSARGKTLLLSREREGRETGRGISISHEWSASLRKPCECVLQQKYMQKIPAFNDKRETFPKVIRKICNG